MHGLRVRRKIRRFQRLFACVAVLGIAVGSTVLAIPSASAAGSTGGSRAWVERYDRPGSKADTAAAVAVSPGGSRIYVSGESLGKDGAPDVQTTIAYTFHGDTAWSVEQTGTGLHPSVAVSSDGDVVFVANRSKMSAYRTTDGMLLWSVTGTPGGLIASDPAGGQVFAAGILDDCLAVRAYDQSTGDALWTGSHCFSATSYARAIAVSPDGSHVFVTGEDDSDSGGAYYTGTGAFDASTGDLSWFRGFGKCCSSRGLAIAVSPDDARVFVSAYDSNTFARIAYRSADGKTLWQRQGGAGGLGIVAGAGVDQNRIFIATDRFTIAAYNASTGDRVWHARYGGAGDISTALGIAPDGGRVYLTGQTPIPGNGTDFATVAFGAAGGSTRWVSRYNGPGDSRDVARALAVSPVGGSVYVAGASVGSGTGSDFATVNYRG